MEGEKELNLRNAELEGGSDSEGSEEDLTSEESNKLFKQIISRNDTRNGYKSNNWRAKNIKLNMRKKRTNPGLCGENLPPKQ